MQELIFAAPKAGPKSRPAAGREDTADVAPVERKSSERGREDDFGSVVDAEERASATKPAGDSGTAESAEVSEAGPPSEETAVPEDTAAFEAETVADIGPDTPVPLPIAGEPEPAPADGDVPIIDSSVADAAPVDAAVPEDPEALAAPLAAGLQVSGDVAASAAAVGSTAPRIPAAQAASVAPPVTGDAADAPTPDTDVVPATRAGPEAPSGAAQSADLRAAAQTQPQVALPPVAAGGFALGGVVTDGLDWRLTPHAHAPTPAQTTAQVQPQAVTGQIAVAIAQSANSRIEVRLDPPELGRVQIQLNPTDRGVQVIVMSERPETGDFLRRHGETLARDLADAGYGDVTMEFTAGGSDTPRERDGAKASAPRAFVAAETSTVTAESAPERPRAVAAGTLDIRL